LQDTTRPSPYEAGALRAGDHRLPPPPPLFWDPRGRWISAGGSSGGRSHARRAQRERDTVKDALTAIWTRRTPQSAKADDRQVPNSAGGFTFTPGRTARLHRFLTLGTDGGTYYVSERDITAQNAGIVLGWAREAAAEPVREATAISQAGRAPRNNPALFALAAAASLGDEAGRRAALDALPLVARTGTHLFLFARYVQQFRGWGRGLRRAVGDWYLAREPDQLAYQVLKYRQREGWSHRDLLRLSHPAGSGAHRALFDFVCGREADLAELPLVEAFVKAQAATQPAQWVNLIRDNLALSWEMLPDAALTSPLVWMALLDKGMPQTALMRQLPRLTRLGVLGPASAGIAAVAAQLADRERLARARVHPVSVLVALRPTPAGTAPAGGRPGSRSARSPTRSTRRSTRRSARSSRPGSGRCWHWTCPGR
jgi:60 kDa SS-A/Ro ribonucleoprotein